MMLMITFDAKELRMLTTLYMLGIARPVMLMIRANSMAVARAGLGVWSRRGFVSRLRGPAGRE